MSSQHLRHSEKRCAGLNLGIESDLLYVERTRLNEWKTIFQIQLERGQYMTGQQSLGALGKETPKESEKLNRKRRLSQRTAELRLRKSYYLRAGMV